MKNKVCIYCGNNPVPHSIYWFNETFNILLTPIRQIILFNPVTRLIKKNRADSNMALFFLSIAEKLKIISRQTDSAKCKVRRAQVLWEEAKKRGIKMDELLLFGKPFDCYVASKRLEVRGERQEHKTIVFSGLPRPQGYSNNRLDLMDDKAWLKKFFVKNNLPVPVGGAATSIRQAEKIFSKIQKQNYNQKVGMSESRNVRSQIYPTSDLRLPVIIKPRAGSRGRHSTTFVSSVADLKQAFKVAKQLCRWVMVEEQLFGPVYRATLINFELCGVLMGDNPKIIGDGQHNISELIEIKNKQEHLGVKDIKVDNSTEVFLSRQNLKLVSILENNQTVYLTEKIGVNYGGSSSEDFDICHPDNKELFARAAKVLGDPIVGFDFIIADITKSYKEQKCGFLEVNSLPFINLHHDPLLGKPRNVAAKIWDMLAW